MSSFSFTDPVTQRTFKVKVPAGVTEDQARTVFQQQLTTGSLVGVEVGATLSAATQAAAGLPAAQAVLAQAASVAAGKLPGASALNTITSQLGAVPGVVGGLQSALPTGAALQSQLSAAVTQAGNNFTAAAGQLGQLTNQLQSAAGTGIRAVTGTIAGLPGAGQVAGALTGAGAALASTAIGVPVNAALAASRAASAIGTGVAGAVTATGSFISQQASALASVATTAVTSPGSVLGAATALVGKAGTAITGALDQAGSFVGTAVKNLATGLTGTVTNGINTADLIKQGTALPVPDLGSVDTQAALSQAAKLVGQPRNKMSDTLGLGKFGLDLGQLEKSGYVKPGTAASVTAAAAAGVAGATLTKVLASPAVFTGKDGIKTVQGLLNNDAIQNTIQSDLMTRGLNELKSAGIPISDLNAGAVAGLANNVAKSLPDTVSSLLGTAAPDVKAAFDATVKNSAFAVSLANTKTDPAVVGEVSAAPASNTVNNETLNAAATRVVGNAKVPSVTEPPKRDAYDVVFAALEWIKQLANRGIPVDKGVTQAQKDGAISQAEWDRLDALYKSVAREFNQENAKYIAEVTQAVKELPEGNKKNTLTESANVFFRNCERVVVILTRLRTELNELREKIQA